MKKLIAILSCLALTVSLASCGAKSKKAEVPQLDPAQLITAEDVSTIAGYTPVVDENGTSREGNIATVTYRSNPIGDKDPVIVKLTQFSDSMPYEKIYDQYEATKASRPKAELIESIGQETFLAIPTIHVYDRGCLVEITAGSGGDNDQKEMLQKFANVAAGRVEEVIPEYKASK